MKTFIERILFSFALICLFSCSASLSPPRMTFDPMPRHSGSSSGETEDDSGWNSSVQLVHVYELNPNLPAEMMRALKCSLWSWSRTKWPRVHASAARRALKRFECSREKQAYPATVLCSQIHRHEPCFCWIEFNTDAHARFVISLNSPNQHPQLLIFINSPSLVFISIPCISLLFSFFISYLMLVLYLCFFVLPIPSNQLSLCFTIMPSRRLGIL